jgi:multicomponent Na+:H+ antiporter subunit C
MIEMLVDTLRRQNFLAFVVLFLCGLFIAITNHNLVKKCIGLYLIQTSVLFLLVTFSARQGATVPILASGRPFTGGTRALMKTRF